MRLEGKSAEELFQIVADRNETQAMLASRFKEAGIDALVVPAHPIVAQRHEMFRRMTVLVAYNIFWNLVDYPTACSHFFSARGGGRSEPV